MPRSLAAPALPTEGKKPVPARASLSPEYGQEVVHVRTVRLTDLLAESCAEHLAEKDAALSQGYSPEYWAHIKAGNKNAQLDPIAELPVEVQREFVTRWGMRIGLRLVTRDARRIAQARLLAAMAEVQEIEEAL